MLNHKQNSIISYRIYNDSLKISGKYRPKEILYYPTWNNADQKTPPKLQHTNYKLMMKNSPTKNIKM